MRQARRLTKASQTEDAQVASAPAGEGAQDAGPAEERACELGAVEGERA